MWQILIRCSLLNLLIFTVRNFQRFFIRSLVSAYELNLYLEIRLDCKKDHHSNKFFLTISSTMSLRVPEVREQKEM